MKTNGNDPANPMITEWRDSNGESLPGLSKREYFAAQALISISGELLGSEDWVKDQMRIRARDAVFLADALIDALNERG